MENSPISIRPMELSDMVGVWTIRNDERVRQMSNATGSIPLKDHRRWFSAYIDRPNKVALVMVERQDVIGYCRIDDGLVSIAIAPSHQGRGLSKPLLAAGIHRGLAVWPTLQAEVRTDNPASLRLFTDLGFVQVGQHDNVFDLRLTRPT